MSEGSGWFVFSEGSAAFEDESCGNAASGEEEDVCF